MGLIKAANECVDGSAEIVSKLERVGINAVNDGESGNSIHSFIHLKNS